MFTYPTEIFKKVVKDSISEIKLTELYLEQDSTTDKKNGLMIASPALLLEYAVEGSMRQHGHDIQSGVVNVKMHLVTIAPISNGKRLSKVQPTDHMAVFDKVYKTFNGFSAKLSFLTEFIALLNTPQDERVFNSLARVDFALPTRFQKTLMKSTQTFKCVMYDHAATKVYSRPAPLPGLELEAIVEGEL